MRTMSDLDHRVLRLWRRETAGGPMIELDALDAVESGGILGDHTFGRLRHVTIVFEDDWNAAAATLSRDVDPAGRRANVLVSGSQGARFVGGVVRIGPVRVEVKGITAPCPVMDKAAPGMQQALEPDGRAGVWGRVVAGGRIAVGDELTAERQS
jgi:MOSC domain-containing protein YiiM